jgi:RES domain-containing protein
MEAYRLSREKFATVLSGKGAALKGARWNSVGVELIYTATNRSLAMAEVAVHLSLATLPSDYVIMQLHIPDDVSLQKINTSSLPLNWNAFPHPPETQAIGDGFIYNNEYCILQIPSAVTQGDYNLLINPNHPDFRHIKIVSTEKFTFDQRMFR